MSRSPVYHLIPEEETFERRIQERLRACRESTLASAFYTLGAFRSLEPALREALENRASMNFLLGRFDFVTEPRAVDALLRLSKRYPGQMRVLFDADFGFHYKLSTFKAGSDETVIIGSSNLTSKGLGTIGEVNLEISGNRGVYRQANEFLARRIKDAIAAEDAIDEYRRLFNRAKKYRRQRLRWMNRGQKAWTPQRRRKQRYLKPQDTRLAYCRIDELVQDEILQKNVKSEHDRAVGTGLKFPNQWVQLDKQSERNFKQDENFVVCDNLSNHFGFAVCTRKLPVLDEHGKPQMIIFYRYLRGWKAQFHSTARFGRAVKQLGFADRDFLGVTLSGRLKAYLRKRRSR